MGKNQMNKFGSDCCNQSKEWHDEAEIIENTVELQTNSISKNDFICSIVEDTPLDTWERCKLIGKLSDFFNAVKQGKLTCGDATDANVEYDRLLL